MEKRTPVVRTGHKLIMESLETFERQEAWAKKQAAWHAKQRQRRVAELQRRERDIGDALSAMRMMPRGGLREVQLRRSFLVARSDVAASYAGDLKQHRRDELVRRPPLTRVLLTPRADLPVRLYLTAVFTAHAQPGPGGRWENPMRTRGTSESWMELLGARSDGPDADSFQRRLWRALEHLEAEQLVSRGRSRKHPWASGWSLLQEDGSGTRYTRPKAAELTVPVPAQFWTQGWCLALTRQEIALWLILRRAASGAPDDPVRVDPRTRRDLYGLSDAAYSAAQAGLVDIGLLEADRNRPWRLDARRRGVVFESYAFTLNDHVLRKNAVKTIVDRFGELKVPRYLQ